ncbi:hypothetical protein E5288_WYG001976 [Bos mutus]|uniref:Uncharacterized protein n=1 Tax=Bos mutus TaxID=72004 RepID=A0A6B0RMM4_9CETA|nr:hypothetical protein [Bos mutus]
MDLGSAGSMGLLGKAHAAESLHTDKSAQPNSTTGDPKGTVSGQSRTVKTETAPAPGHIPPWTGKAVLEWGQRRGPGIFQEAAKT